MKDQLDQLQSRHIDGQALHFLPASQLHPADTYFHFSFANYHDPERMGFGVLRVLNDDDVLPHSGFDRHPHRDMEIVSYVVSGELTHWDSATNAPAVLRRGHVQTVTAGTGVWHSELNRHAGHTRFLQIWILPPAAGLPVRYENQAFDASQRQDKLLQIVDLEIVGPAELTFSAAAGNAHFIIIEMAQEPERI